MNYKYRGVIPASKSIMNRALICASYSSNLSLQGDSSCDDVLKMKKAYEQLRDGGYTAAHRATSSDADAIFDCGAAGTVLRFLSLRLSRIPGRHILKGTTRLMSRPQQDLLDIFTRLGVQYDLSEDQMILNSNGWKNLDQPIIVQRGVSSQFASGLILNAWNLDQDLVLHMTGDAISEGYLEMTLEVVKALGMQVEWRDKIHLKSNLDSDSDLDLKQRVCVIKAHSHVIPSSYVVESDLSSVFAIAAYAALNGEAIFESFPQPSLQPDFEFVHLLERMQIPVEFTQGQLIVRKTETFKGVEANLKSCPDLFPVLAILCAFASTPSTLYGAPQLIHKESDRIAKISELLTKINVHHEKKPDGIIILPNPLTKMLLSESVSQFFKNHPLASSLMTQPFTYNTDHDHRLAFAAALVKSQGLPIQILHPEVVSKSFPEFWQVVQ